MKYLFVKLRRDISRMWVQFFAVFMMSVLAITIYSGMEGVWYGLKCETNDYYTQTKLADAWVNGSMITDDMVKDVRALDDVKKVTRSMTATVQLDTDKNDKPDVKLMSMDSTALFDPVIRDGETFDKDSSDGIWLDETICKERGLEVGDKITLKYGQAKKTFRIKGTILDSEFIYYTGSVTDTVPNHKIHGYGLTGSKAAESFYGMYICNELRLDVSKGCDYTKLQADVEDILGDSYLNFSERDDISSVSQITKEINQMQNMANLFSAVFIILAVLSMYSTMTRLISTQTTQIGTMKAIGFSNAAIRLHYICYGFFVSLAGSCVGIFFGKALVSRAVMKVKKATLTLPEWQVSLSFRIYLIIGGIVLVCVLATILAAQKGLNKMPAESMRNTANVKSGRRHFDPDRFRIWRNLDYRTKWMTRDNMQNIIRWVMSIIGVAGSMVLMMAGLGFRDSINFSNDYVYNTQYSYEYKVVLNNGYDPAQLDDLESEIKSDYQTVYEYNLDMYYPDSDNKERRTISVIDKGDYVNLDRKDGKALKLTDSTVAVSSKIAGVLGISEGDELKVRVLGDDKYHKLKITDVVMAPSPQGIFVSSGYWEDEMDREYTPSAVLMESKADYDAVRDMDIVKETSTIGDQLASMKIMTKSVMTIIYLMIVASVLLGCIIIYNLGMLNYIERFRDYATMKVLGFYQREVRSIIIRDCMITTVLGWLIGIPAGYKFLSFYIGIVQFKTFEWVPALSVPSFIVASVVVFACSIIVNMAVAHKVTKISMIEALKSVE